MVTQGRNPTQRELFSSNYVSLKLKLRTLSEQGAPAATACRKKITPQKESTSPQKFHSQLMLLYNDLMIIAHMWIDIDEAARIYARMLRAQDPGRPTDVAAVTQASQRCHRP